MRLALLAAALILIRGVGAAGGTPQGMVPGQEARILVAMATCKTVPCVKAAYAKIRKPEVVAGIVYYTNLLRLRPRDRAASCSLLKNIPDTDDEYDRLTSLDGNLYPGETDQEIRAVGQWGLSRSLARALDVCPRFLPGFIRYGILAVQDPTEDDYPDWAARVCRSNPKRFLAAFRTLAAKDQRYIAKYVIRPEGCKQIAFPEAR